MTWLFGPIGMQAIKTIKYFKSTFGDLIADSRSRIDPKALQSTVSGKLNTVIGQKVVSSEQRTFVYDWEYVGMSLKLVGFHMVQPKSRTGVSM